MIETWQELLNKNSSQRPIAVGGYSRGGTTFAYRNLCNHVRAWHLEEYFHKFYEFHTLESGEIAIDKHAIEQKKSTNTPVNGHMEEDHDPNAWRQIQLERYYNIRRDHPWHKVFIKVLPLHCRELYSASPSAYKDLCSSHYWLFVLRRDYVNMILSNLYSNYFNHFHYYDDTPLKNKPFTWEKLDDVNTIYKDQWIWLKRMWYSSGEVGEFVFSEDFAPSLREDKHKFAYAPSPRFDLEKPKLYREVFQNYDQVVERIHSMAQEVEQETQGFFKFTDTEVKVNI